MLQKDTDREVSERRRQKGAEMELRGKWGIQGMLKEEATTEIDDH